MEIAEFQNPPKKNHPFVRWWWPGLDVEPKELLREIEELDTQGFGGAEIQAFCLGTPGPKNEDRSKFFHRFAPHPYYYEMLTYTLQEAQKRGLTIDLTISSSWPPGGSWVTKKDSLQTLMMGTQIIKGNKHIDIPIPPIQLNAVYKKFVGGIAGNNYHGFWEADFKPIATLAIHPIKKNSKLNFVLPKATPLAINSVQNITEKVDPQGIIHWDAPAGVWQIFTIYAGPSAMKAISDAKSAPDAKTLVVDMLDHQRVQSFLAGHLEPGLSQWKPFFGTTLRALFTDSQEIGAEWYWTDVFFDEFQKRRGYDVRSYLPICFVPNRDNQFTNVFFLNTKPCFDFPKGIGERIRYDWELTLSDLFAENYVEAVAKWGKPYQIQHRIQTYGIRVDLLKAYGKADIPESEQLFAGGLMDFLKLAGSAGIIYNKPIVSCESLVWMQRDYMTTPFKWKVAADRLFVAGINQMIYHGFPYQTAWKVWPGQYPWSPPCYSSNLNRNNPFWQFFPSLNQYVARGQYLLQQGKTEANVGIYYMQWNYDYKVLRKEDLAGGVLPGFDADPPKGPILWFMQRATKATDKFIVEHQRIADEIMQAGYSYVHINDEILEKSPIENGALIAGSAKLKILIFILTEAIPLSVAEKLQTVAQQGIHIIFYGKIPNRQPGYWNYAENDQKVQQLMTALPKDQIHEVSKKSHIGQYMKDIIKLIPGLIFDDREHSIQYIQKTTEWGSLYFVRHTKAQSKSTILTFPKAHGQPYQLDLWTGKVYRIKNFQQTPQGTVIPIEFQSYESKMILLREQPFNFDREISWGSNKIEIAKKYPEIKWNTWRIQAQKRLITGEYEPIEILLTELKDWRKIPDLRYCSGPAKYITEIDFPQQMITSISATQKLWLNLGKVQDVATIKINDHEWSPLLIPPYEVEITPYIHPGKNLVEITIHATIRNILVGYGNMGANGYRHHKKRPLMPVGLIGPVHMELREE